MKNIKIANQWTNRHISHLWLHLLRRITRLISFGNTIRTPGKIMQAFFCRWSVAIEIDDFDGNLSMLLELHEHIQSQIFWLGYYNLDIAPILDHVLQEGMTVIDVGANIGEVSLLAAQRVGSSGTVIAFEPLEELTRKLETNAKRNHFNQIKIIRRGLADFEGSRPLYLPSSRFSDSTKNDGLGSLYPSAQRNIQTRNIQLTTLDKHLYEYPISRLDLIKIDIEGAELPCLRGSTQTLRRFNPIIIIEIQHDSTSTAGYDAKEILDFLSRLHYKCYSIGRNGQITHLDFLDKFQNVVCLPKNYSW